MKKSDLLYMRSKNYRDLMDKIHDSIQEEDRHEKTNDSVAAADTGLRTWSYLKKLMTILDATNLCDMEHETMYDLLSWACSLATNLCNASTKDSSFLRKKYDFCKEYTQMHESFSSDGMRNLGNIRRVYAGCYIDQSDFKTCDDLYEKWLLKEPNWGWGWIGWSDSYWLFTGKNKKNFEKAFSILEQGLAIKGVNDKNYMLDRLNSLKKEILINSDKI